MLIHDMQGRIQGRRQSDIPLGSLKNKDHMIKNKIFLIRIFYLLESDILYRSFLTPPLIICILGSKMG
jgi:hypothetical protein